jgi:multiple sugar transport system substrate-binding protein
VPLVDKDATKAVVNTPAAVAFLTKLAAVYQAGGIPPDSVTAKQRSEIETFSDGKAAYLESGASRLKIIKQNSPTVYAQLGVGTPLGNATSRTWVVAHGLAVPTTSKNAATALAFAKFLTAADQQLAFARQSSIFPSTTASLNDPFFAATGGDLPTAARAIGAASLREGRTLAVPSAVDSEYQTALWSAVQPAILGKVTPETALRNAETALTKILRGRQR